MATIGDRTTSSTFDGLKTQISISYSLLGVTLVAFDILRQRYTLRHLYLARSFLTKYAKFANSYRNATEIKIPNFLFGWIINVFKIDESYMLQHTGLDSVMHLRLLRSGFLILLAGCILISLPLLPLNYGSGSKDSERVRESDMDFFSIGNVPSNSNILFVHMILMYIFSGLVIYRLWRDSAQFVKLKRKFGVMQLRNGGKAIRTVMVTNLPKNLRDDKALKNHFESLNVGQVEEAVVARYPRRLIRAVQRREKALSCLELAHLELAKRVLGKVRGRNPTIYLTPSDIDHHAALRDFQRMEQDHAKRGILARLWWFMKSLGPRSSQPPAISPHTLFSLESGMNEERDMSAQGASRSDINNFWVSLSNLPRGSLDRYHPQHRPMKAGYNGRNNNGQPDDNRAANDAAISRNTEYKSAINHYFEKFNSLDAKVQYYRKLGGAPGDKKPTSTGFVTFKNATSAQLCAQSVVSTHSAQYSVQMAPEPRDIIWENLVASRQNIGFRKVIVRSSVWYFFFFADCRVLTIFWLFPLSAILFLTSYNTLSKNIPALGELLSKNAFLNGVIKDLMPASLSALFMTILPFVIYKISEHEYFMSYSSLEFATLNRYYRFAFFNVIIVFLIGSAFLEYFLNLVRGTANVLEWLANFIPAGSNFFINYVIFGTVIHGLELVQLWVPLIMSLITNNNMFSKLPREMQHYTSPWVFYYYYYYPLHILMLVICIVYAVLAPLILIFGAIYFGVAHIVFKQQYAYVYVRQYEANGKAWRYAFGYIYDGLIFAQFTLVSMLSLKEMIYAGAGLVPLIVFTIYMRIRTRKKFRQRMKYIPLELLAQQEIEIVKPVEAAADGGISKVGSPLPVVPISERQNGQEHIEMQQFGSSAAKLNKISFSSLSISTVSESDSSSQNAEKHAGDNIATESGAEAMYGGSGNLEENDQDEGMDHSTNISHNIKQDFYEQQVSLKAADPQRAVAVRHFEPLPTKLGISSEPPAGSKQGSKVVVVTREKIPSQKENIAESSKKASDANSEVQSLANHKKGKGNPILSPIIQEKITESGSSLASRYSISKEAPAFVLPWKNNTPDAASKHRIAPENNKGLPTQKDFIKNIQRRASTSAAIVAQFIPGAFLQDSPPESKEPSETESIYDTFDYPTTSSRILLQDMVSDPDIYQHPALTRQLTRRLWLQADPLQSRIDLDKTIELDHALVGFDYQGDGTLGANNSQNSKQSRWNYRWKRQQEMIKRREARKNLLKASEDDTSSEISEGSQSKNTNAYTSCDSTEVYSDNSI